MTHFFEGQSRTIDYRVDGRLGIGELNGLLAHLGNDYQHPWIESFYYRYDEGTNRSYLTLIVTNDRPHNVLAGGTTAGESGKAAGGSVGSDEG